MKFILTLFLGASFFFGPSENSTGKLRIKIEGLDVREGIIGLMVFNQEDGFPTEKEKAYFPHRCITQ